MEEIKKGDIVARKSHNCDILFLVENILKGIDGKNIVILKGITIRIVADAYMDDLKLFDELEISSILNNLDNQINTRINTIYGENNKYINRNRIDVKTRENITFRWR